MPPVVRSYASSVDRWAGLGPYYAMFPVDFAFSVVRTYTHPGGTVLDPFAGRASSIFAAATTGRYGVGVELNPVGWIYGSVKLAPAPEGAVLARLRGIGEHAKQGPPLDHGELPAFFRSCYCQSVLDFLLIARDRLAWRDDPVDRTLMAILLVYLHGKAPYSLSNQMRQGKSMAPDYSLRWWSERGMRPPEIDPVQFLEKRIRWRYLKGIPDTLPSSVIHGDATAVLPAVEPRGPVAGPPFDLLFTSPPYWSVTNYHYDQWLRLWMLGGESHPTGAPGPWEGRFWSRPRYQALLDSVFAACSDLMRATSTIYVRTDARAFTLDTTLASLRSAFPRWRLRRTAAPCPGPSQTALFGDKSKKPGEVDIIMVPRRSRYFHVIRNLR